MASVIGERDHLCIELSTGEKWAALRRTDLRIRWTDIDSVEQVAEPFRLMHGLRAPGLALPWRTKIGTWRSAGRKIFAVTRAGTPGIRMMVHGNGFDEILLSLPHPTAATRLIAAGVSDNRSGPSPRPPSGATGQADRSLPEGGHADGGGPADGSWPADGSGPAGSASRTDQPIERLLTFRSAGVELAGTALLPAGGRRPIAAAVIVTGSGKLDRDGSDRRAPIDVSRQLAYSLLAHGIASLRYDKRGVAASGGDYYRTGLYDNIGDAAAAVESLAQQPECAGVPLVLIGHSEGALIATAVAADPDSALSGVVLLAGPAKTGEQTLQWQAAKITPTLPKPVRLILRVFRTDPAKRQRTFITKIRASSGDAERIGGAKINAKWFRELLDFDPVPLLAAIDVPVLAITGDKDLQVDPADLDIIAAKVPGPVTTRRVEDLTHILRLDPAEPTLGTYRKLIKQPVDPVVMQHISEWIEQIADADGELQRPAAG